MNGYQKVAVGLLAAIAIEGAVCVGEIVRIARDGFNVELSLDQASALADSVSVARSAALSDMAEELEEE